MNIDQELAHERQKLALIQKQAERSQKRIAALEALLGDQPDEMDALLDKLVQPVASALAAQEGLMGYESALPIKRGGDNYQEEYAVSGFSRVRKDSKWPAIVLRVGKQGATLDEIEEFSKGIGAKSLSRGSIRTMMMKLREVKYMDETGKNGFYRATDLGLESARKAIAKSETPSGATDGVSGVQQSPLEGLQ